MKHFTRHIFIIGLCFSLFFNFAKAYPQSTAHQETLQADSIHGSYTFSLLTCGPGSESYTLYGHTAIRIVNEVAGEDFVINYGIFSFNQPHFMLRFLLGKPDYRVEAVPFAYFIQEYQLEHRWVKEQVLQLTNTEKETLMKAIANNLRPENSTYRYNIFTANCTTKAADIIESSLQHPLHAPSPAQSTYRSEVHKYLKSHPWNRFGVDLLLGVNADRILPQDKQVFLPEHLSDYFGAAKTEYEENTDKSDAQESTLTPFVSATNMLNPPTESAGSNETPLTTVCSPRNLLSFIALLVIVLSFCGYRRKRFFVPFDIAIASILGIAGCALLFMAFSEHPTVSLNTHILLLNPLYLFCICPLIGISRRNKSAMVNPDEYRQSKPVRIFLCGVIVLCAPLFILSSLIQQHADGTLLLSVALFIRYYFLLFRQASPAASR